MLPFVLPLAGERLWWLCRGVCSLLLSAAGLHTAHPNPAYSTAPQAAQGLPDEALSALRSHAVVRQLSALLEPAVPACSDLHVSAVWVNIKVTGQAWIGETGSHMCSALHVSTGCGWLARRSTGALPPAWQLALGVHSAACIRR